MRVTALAVFVSFMARAGGAQGVDSPLAGLVLDQYDRIVPVHGVFGNLLRGEPIALPPELDGKPVSAVFSDAIGVLKSAANLVIVDGSGREQQSIQVSGDGPAMVSFAADGSLQWFCAGSCAALRSLQGATVAAPNTGAIVALGSTAGGSVPVLTQSGGQLWSSLLNLSDSSVSNQVAIPGSTPAVALNAGWLTTTATGLIWTDLSGTATAIAMTEPVKTLEPAGSRTAAINRRWLLNGTLQLLEIPVRPHLVRHEIRISPVVTAQ